MCAEGVKAQRDVCVCDESLNFIQTSKDASLLNPQKKQTKASKEGHLSDSFLSFIFLQTHIDSIFTLIPHHTLKTAFSSSQKQMELL